MLHEERFVDLSPAEVYAKLLDEGVYLCSLRTMYRILAEHGEVHVHADHGAPMVSKPVAHLLADLGVAKTHSRPHVRPSSRR